MPLTVYADFQVNPAPRPSIAVVGLGYIGLPTAAALANAGFDVIGFDIDPAVADRINAGKSHIVEPGLDALLASVVADGGLRAVHTPPEADVYMIAVPTPIGHDDDRHPDLSHVFSAADSIAPHLRPGALVILESTSPVGTTRQVVERMAALRPDLGFPLPGRTNGDADVAFAYSPERVIPGRTLEELATNSRVVGGVTPEASRRAAAIYSALTAGELLITDDRTAELVKLTENAFRDVNIAFANELSLVCERMEVGVWEVIELANRHPRVNILRPGPGVGGHCIAVDPWFIVASAPDEARLIRTAREVNDAKPRFIIDKVRSLMDADYAATLGCLGLAFKPNVDDFRESPALAIAMELSRLYPGRVVCTDPFAGALPGHEGLVMASLNEALRSEIIVSLVAHDAFKQLDPPKSDLIDACGLWR